MHVPSKSLVIAIFLRESVAVGELRGNAKG